MTVDPFASSGFIGWRRAAAGPWRPMVQADDAATCSQLLLALPVPPGVQHTDVVVLPAGQRPDRRRDWRRAHHGD